MNQKEGNNVFLSYDEKLTVRVSVCVCLNIKKLLKNEPHELGKLAEDLQRGKAANFQRSPPGAGSLQQL